jgi:hypothetical protein
LFRNKATQSNYQRAFVARFCIENQCGYVYDDCMKNQMAEYLALRKFLSIKTLPLLQAAQIMRAQENIAAGLELGLTYDQSARMAAEDFATPAEKLAVAELADNVRWLYSQDPHDILMQMAISGFHPNGR